MVPQEAIATLARWLVKSMAAAQCAAPTMRRKRSWNGTPEIYFAKAIDNSRLVKVENPQRSYPIALAVVIPLSIATYFLPTMFSLAALGDWQKWHTGYFSDAAVLIGGHGWVLRWPWRR